MKFEKYRVYIAYGITAFLVLAAAIVTFFLFNNANLFARVLKNFLEILSPFFIGMVLAYLLSPLYNVLTQFLTDIFSSWIKKPGGAYKLSSTVSMIISILAAFLIVYALIAMVIPGFVDSLTSKTGLIAMMPTYIRKAVNELELLLADYPDLVSQIDDLYHNSMRDVVEFFETTLSNLNSLSNTMGGIITIFSDVFSSIGYLVKAILNIFIGVVVTCYLLQGKSKLIAQSKKITYCIFGAEFGNRIILRCRYIHEIFGGFIRGKLIDSLIIGVLCFIATSLVSIPYPLVVSVIVGITNVIPFFGPIIGAVPTVLLVVLVNPIKALWLLLIILAIQQLDGNVIGPKILGDATGLSSFWVLFSIVLFGGLWGFVGMVIAVPLFAVIYTMVDEIVNNALKKRKLSCATADYYHLDHIKMPEEQYIKMPDPTIKNPNTDTLPKPEANDTVTNKADTNSAANE